MTTVIKKQFLQGYRRHDLPIAAAGKMMGHNRYRSLGLCLALVVAKPQQYEIQLNICARLLNRLNLDHLRDCLDELEADQIDDLVIMIPACCYLNAEDFPCCAIE